MTTHFTKTASSHLDDTGAAYDTLSAPIAVVTPGHGKHAEHADAHRADMPGSTIKHVGHTRELVIQFALCIKVSIIKHF